jgi:hypothetical protein
MVPSELIIVYMLIVALLQPILKWPFIAALQGAECPPYIWFRGGVGVLGFDIDPVCVKCTGEFEDLRGHEY